MQVSILNTIMPSSKSANQIGMNIPGLCELLTPCHTELVSASIAEDPETSSG